jgi:hypothetical protein
MARSRTDGKNNRSAGVQFLDGNPAGRCLLSAHCRTENYEGLRLFPRPYDANAPINQETAL